MTTAAVMTTIAPPCEALAWDSEHFGCRIGRVQGGCLDREQLAAIDFWCRTEAIDCLYFLVDAGDPATAALAEEAGFRLVDVRVTLEGKGRGKLGEGPGVRAAGPEDVPALRRIAAVSHRDSRFYADPHFDRARCDELYATWIEKGCHAQWTDQTVAVLVVGQEGEPMGYISCQGGEGLVGEIGLLAVAPAAQGRGLGGALVAAGLHWFVERGAASVRVVTQGRNVRAQRLYQAHGLFTRSIGLWFHRWRGSR